MWHAGLKNLLSYEEDQQYKEYCQQQRTFKQRVEFISNLKSISQEDILEKIFNWSKVVYPPVFQMQFCPIELNQKFMCQVCQKPFTMHMKLAQCDHVACFQCLHDHFLKQINDQQFLCPICDQIVQKIEFNAQILREQLETTVICPYHEPQEVTMIFYNQVKITKQNNVENLSDKTFELRKQFNNQQIPFEAVNYRRIEELQKHSGYSDQIMSQMNGITKKVGFYHFVPVNKKVTVDGCTFTCLYSEILKHCPNCKQMLKQCRYCFAKYPAKIMEMHVANCIQRPVACTVCFKEYIRLKDYTAHAVKCLARLDEIIKQQKKFGDYGDQEDLELILKVLHLQNMINKLTKVVFQMDNMLQNELLEQIDLWNGPKPAASDKCLWRFSHNFFQKKYLMYTVTESILAVSFLDITHQYGGVAQTISASLVLLVQFAFFVFFLIYAKYFHKFQSFRKSTSKFFVISYFTLIIWFASVFTTIQVLIPDSLHLKFAENSDVTLSPIQFFGEMIYFSAILGCKTGLGDVVPTNILSKFVVCVHVLVTTYITLIWFRGLSFIIKIESLNDQTKKQLHQQRKIQRALTKET